MQVAHTSPASRQLSSQGQAIAWWKVRVTWRSPGPRPKSHMVGRSPTLTYGSPATRPSLRLLSKFESLASSDRSHFRHGSPEPHPRCQIPLVRHNLDHIHTQLFSDTSSLPNLLHRSSSILALIRFSRLTCFGPVFMSWLSQSSSHLWLVLIKSSYLGYLGCLDHIHAGCSDPQETPLLYLFPRCPCIDPYTLFRSIAIFPLTPQILVVDLVHYTYPMLPESFS